MGGIDYYSVHVEVRVLIAEVNSLLPPCPRDQILYINYGGKYLKLYLLMVPGILPSGKAHYLPACLEDTLARLCVLVFIKAHKYL